jgi:hypothetical protein
MPMTGASDRDQPNAGGGHLLVPTAKLSRARPHARRRSAAPHLGIRRQLNLFVTYDRHLLDVTVPAGLQTDSRRNQGSGRETVSDRRSGIGRRLW